MTFLNTNPTTKAEATQTYWNLCCECDHWAKRIVAGQAEGKDVSAMVAKHIELNETRIRIGRLAGFIKA